MTKGVIIMIVAIVLVNVAVAAVCLYVDRKRKAQKEESQEPEPDKQEEKTEEVVVENGDPSVVHLAEEEKPIKDLTPIFKVGDEITNGIDKYTITEVRKVCYVLDNGEYLPLTEQDRWSLVEPEEEDEEVGLFDTLTDYFSKIVPIKDGQVKFFLYCAYREAYNQYFHKDSDYDFPVLYKKENFPVIEDYFTDTEYPYPFEVMTSWLFGCILAELVPEKRNEILNKAYNFVGGGEQVSLYGWSFETDPMICRMVAFDIYNLIMPDEKVPEMMDELGSRMISYTKDISECFVDICSFMPPAAGPYLDEYAKRPCGYPVDYNPMLGGNFAEDVLIHSKVCEKYSLDTEDLEMRQATIQAIANKEHKKPHLFGHFRSVTDPKYGPMTFEPVFGLDSIGIEIPDNGEIANLCYDIGKASTDNRKSLLDREYGRRRPGEGKKDGTANDDPRQRVLVNYAIEDGDGHRTGYYEKNGDYIDDQGNHIGDYVEFYQNAVYANSYPSGHSAFIEGVAGALIHIMPDRADRIIIAKNRFANSRAITRYHWWSDTMIGRLIGTMMLPVMKGVENCDLRERFENAKAEYEALKNGTYKPEPTEKVNISLSYVCGGYGSCHVDAGEQALNHYCNKECYKERHPFINVSQRVEFSIEGAGVKTVDGKTSGVWEAGVNYELVCPAVYENEEKTAIITMRNENGLRVLHYKLSRQGTKDEGAGK